MVLMRRAPKSRNSDKNCYADDYTDDKVVSNSFCLLRAEMKRAPDHPADDVGDRFTDCISSSIEDAHGGAQRST